MHLEERFVIGNSSVLSGDIIWWSDIIPLSTGRAGGCGKPWEHQSLISKAERTNPAWGWSCCASLCRSFWMMNYLQSHFQLCSHMDVRHRGFLRTKKILRAKWNAELNGKGRKCDGSWASYVGVVLLALKDAGIIASKSGNFMLVPQNNERKWTLPKKWEACV